MRKNILIITTLLCLVGFATACDEGGGDNPEPPTTTLIGTKWMLNAYVDTENNTIEAVPPNEWWDSFTIFFNTDSIVTGVSRNYRLAGLYIADYSKSELFFISIGHDTPEVNEDDFDVYEEDLKFFAAMEQVRYFTRTETELKLFYNNKNNYLRFERRR